MACSFAGNADLATI